MQMLKLKSESARSLTRFVQFGLVEASGLLVDMGVFFWLNNVRRFGVGIFISKLFAAETAIINNFIWNEIWTFRDLAVSRTDLQSKVCYFDKFNLIYTMGIGLIGVLLTAQIHFLSINAYLANFTAFFLTGLWDFWMNLKDGWGKPQAAETGATCAPNVWQFKEALGVLK